MENAEGFSMAALEAHWGPIDWTTPYYTLIESLVDERMVGGHFHYELDELPGWAQVHAERPGFTSVCQIVNNERYTLKRAQ